MYKLKSKNIVQSWLKVEENINNISIVSAVHKMNANLKTKYMPARIRAWYESTDSGRGTQLPRRVRLYMSQIVIDHALVSCGLNTKYLDNIDTSRLIKMLH